MQYEALCGKILGHSLLNDIFIMTLQLKDSLDGYKLHILSNFPFVLQKFYSTVILKSSFTVEKSNVNLIFVPFYVIFSFLNIVFIFLFSINISPLNASSCGFPHCSMLSPYGAFYSEFFSFNLGICYLYYCFKPFYYFFPLSDMLPTSLLHIS